MKIKLLLLFAILAITIAAIWNVNFNSQRNGLSVLALANIEALSNSEEPGEGGKKCKQTFSTVNESYKCSSGFYYMSSGTNYSCISGDGHFCKSGFVGTTSDCGGIYTNTTDEDLEVTCL